MDAGTVAALTDLLATMRGVVHDRDQEDEMPKPTAKQKAKLPPGLLKAISQGKTGAAKKPTKASARKGK